MFTKGDWKLQLHKGFKDVYDIYVELDNGGKDIIAELVEEHNAHLMVSAPELYEALKEGLKAVRWILRTSTGYISEVGIDVPQLIAQIEQAIAKVEGR